MSASTVLGSYVLYYVSVCEKLGVSFLLPVVDWLTSLQTEDGSAPPSHVGPPQTSILLEGVTDGELEAACAVFTLALCKGTNSDPALPVPPPSFRQQQQQQQQQPSSPSPAPSLVSLSVINSNLSARGVSALTSFLSRVPNLPHLSLSGLPLGSSGALALSESLLLNPTLNLQTLDVSRSNLDSRALESLTTAACELRSLSLLSLSGNSQLGPKAGLVLARALRLRLGLPSLLLGGCRLGDRGLAAIGGALAAKNSGPWRCGCLDVGDNEITAEGMRPLCLGLREAFSNVGSSRDSGVNCLRTLRLGGNAIGDDGAMLLSDVLLSRESDLNRALEDLDLSSCNLGVRGVVAVASALPLCSSLTACDLSGGPLSPDVLVAIGNALAENESIKVLDLSPSLSNASSALAAEKQKDVPAGLASFATNLRGNVALLTLRLGMYLANPATATPAAAIHATLALNARLRGMTDGASVGDAAAAKHQQQQHQPALSSSEPSSALSSATALGESVLHALESAANATARHGPSPSNFAARGEVLQRGGGGPRTPPPSNRSLERENSASGAAGTGGHGGMNPFASPPAAAAAMTSNATSSGGFGWGLTGVVTTSPFSDASASQQKTGNPFNSPAPLSALSALAPAANGGSALLGASAIATQLSQHQLLLTTDAIRAARMSWEAEFARDMAALRASCMADAKAMVLEMESKVADVVGRVADDAATGINEAREEAEQRAVRAEEATAELAKRMEGLEARVEDIERLQKESRELAEAQAASIHAVEVRTQDGAYIQQFVARMLEKIKAEVKAEVRKELNAEHEKAVTSLEVNRHIDHSRLDGKCSQLAERLAGLEVALETERRNNLDVLEAILSSQR